MVVSYVVSAVKLEVLIFILLFQRDRNLSLENHVHFFEVVAFFYHDLVTHKIAAVQLGDKVCHELFAASCEFKFKQMVEMLEELGEQLLNKS